MRTRLVLALLLAAPPIGATPCITCRTEKCPTKSGIEPWCGSGKDPLAKPEGKTGKPEGKTGKPEGKTGKPEGKTGKPEGKTTCPAGMQVTTDTLGRCCWPGQAWAKSRKACVGAPSSCPTGLTVQGESCLPMTRPQSEIEAKAAEHLRRGALFRESREHGRAAAEFAAAYGDIPDRSSLLQAAEMYRLDGKESKALEFYRKFLATQPPVTEHADVEAKIRDLEAIVGSREPVKPEPVKPEPVKPEPVKPEPVKPEPIGPDVPPPLPGKRPMEIRIRSPYDTLGPPSADPARLDTPDGAFRAGVEMLRVGRAEAALGALERYLSFGENNPARRIQAQCHVGEALSMQGKRDRALEAYQRAISLEGTLPAGSPAAEFLARAAFALADARLQWMESQGAGRIPLKSFSEQMNSMLVEFANVARFNRPFWTVASSYRSGNAIEAYATTLRTAPCPATTSGQAQCASYLRNLRELAERLDGQVAAQYRSTLDMAARAGINNDWTERARRKLAR